MNEFSVTKSEPANILIESKSLCVDIKTTRVLQNLSFSVAKGEIYALLGGNGAGKSSTLKTLLGFNHPKSGQAIVDGHDVTHDPSAVRNKTAYLPENASLYPHLTARENVAYFLSLAGAKASINATTRQICRA